MQKPRIFASKKVKNIVEQTIEQLPKEVAEFVENNVTFVGPYDDTWAYTLRKEDLKTNYIIVITEKLLKQKPEDIVFTLVHEIGHAQKGHRNSIGIVQTPGEIRQQEKEADNFAKEILYV